MSEPAESSPVVRLVAIDLDGTLLTDSKRIAAPTADALRRVGAAGVRIVIASARPPRSVRPFYQQLALDTYTINYNGALIWDEPNRVAVQHTPMAPGLVRRIILFAREMFPQVLVSCEILDKWFTDTHEQPYTTETGRLFKPDLIAPLDSFLNQPVTKLMLLGNPEMITQLNVFVNIKFFQHCSAVRADPELIQIMNLQASKAIALLRVATHYQVPMRNVMAIGDAANDVEMLESAGVAVAVDNADPAVKKAADWVAPSNNDHGVAAALRRYGLID